MSQKGKAKKHKHPSYVWQYFSLVIAVTFCAGIILVHYDLQQFKESSAQNIVGIHQTIESYKIYDENNNLLQTFSPNNGASIPAATTFEDALSIMQSQYSDYTSQITIILTIITGGLGLITLIIPIFNYAFLQKEQIDRINLQVSKAKDQFDQSNTQFEETKTKLEEATKQLDANRQKLTETKTQFEELQSRFEKELKRLENSVEQSQQTITKIVQNSNPTTETEKMQYDSSPIKPISDSPSDQARAKFLQALLAQNKSNNEQALTLFRETIQLDPTNARYHNGLSVALHNLKRYEDSLVEVQATINLEPDNAKYHNSLGVTLHALKRYQEALTATQKAIDLEPDNAEYHNDLGTTLHAIKQYEEALIATKKAIEIKPTDARYKINLGSTLYRAGQHTEAIAHLNKVLTDATDPNTVTNLNRGYAYRGLANIQLSLTNEGNAEDGIPDLDQAVELKSSARNYRDRGEGFLLLNQLDEAEADLQKSLSLDDKDADTLYLYSQLLRQRGEDEKADEYWQKAQNAGYIAPPNA